MKRKNLVLTVELLGLFILLVMVITVVARVFVMSRSHSLQARQLTEAVILAENAAEIASSEEDPDKLAERFAGQDGLADIQEPVRIYKESEDSLTLVYAAAFKPGSDSYYIVSVSRDMERYGNAGALANDAISVYAPATPADGAGGFEDFLAEISADNNSADGPVYTLDTSTFFGDVSTGEAQASDVKDTEQKGGE